MKKTYFTVGPSQIYPTVPKHIEEAVREDVLSMSHRGVDFEDLYHEAVSGLRTLLGIPRTHRIYFLSSATECMERVIENTVEARSSHVISGTFGQKFFDISGWLGRVCEKYEVSPSEGLGQMNFERPELIAFTQNDTSTGYRIPMQEIYNIAAAYPDALTAIDVVSSVPYVNIDYSQVDLVFFSVQKGFGLPAGLAVLIVSPRAFDKGIVLEESQVMTGSYHSFANLEKYAEKRQTFETPNVLGIYLLARVIEDMEKLGIEKIRYTIEEKATLLYDFFEESSACSLVVTRSEFQSITTPVVRVEGGSEQLISELAERGYIVGAGYGENRNEQIRIANFPAQSIEDTKRLIEEMKKIIS